MSVQQLRDQIGEFAKDIRINLGSLLTEEGAPELSEYQIHLVALASAYATKSSSLIEAFHTDFHDTIGDKGIDGAKAAASLMAMNNVYYRSLHLMSDPDLSRLPANLRMTKIAKPGIEKVDFELACLAVSAISGCGMCLKSHAHELEKAGLKKEAIQSTIRIASVVNASAQSLFLS